MTPKRPQSGRKAAAVYLYCRGNLVPLHLLTDNVTGYAAQSHFTLNMETFRYDASVLIQRSSRIEEGKDKQLLSPGQGPGPEPRSVIGDQNPS